MCNQVARTAFAFSTDLSAKDFLFLSATSQRVISIETIFNWHLLRNLTQECVSWAEHSADFRPVTFVFRRDHLDSTASRSVNKSTAKPRPPLSEDDCVGNACRHIDAALQFQPNQNNRWGCLTGRGRWLQYLSIFWVSITAARSADWIGCHDNSFMVCLDTTVLGKRAQMQREEAEVRWQPSVQNTFQDRWGRRGRHGISMIHKIRKGPEHAAKIPDSTQKQGCKEQEARCQGGEANQRRWEQSGRGHS